MFTPSALEMGAARALFDARMMLAAVTVSEGWEMQWGSVRIHATRVLTDDGITFIGTFPEVCWLDRPTDGVSLLLDGQVMGIRRVDDPGDTAFIVTWSLATSVPEEV